ncbi:MAG: fumarylacetoacetate hydrolase family protein [Planctomycetota bacterium]
MRLIRIPENAWAAVMGLEDVVPGATVRVRRLLGDPCATRTPRLADAEETVKLPSRLRSPVAPPCLWCIGKNYAEHAREFGGDVPERPVVFMKPGSCVVGSGESVVLPRCQENGPEVDYEAELAVVMGVGPDGTACKDVSVDDALNYVLGYTCGNDISARHWQKTLGGSQWVRGKSFDTFAPLGPSIVTARPMVEGDADVITDPQALAIACELSGETRQYDTTANMFFSVSELIAFLSQDTTLTPGSVILTGTPSGVGAAAKPPRFLRDGDHVEVRIERVGTLSNPVCEASGSGATSASL